jgi:hypothetical protein
VEFSLWSGNDIIGQTQIPLNKIVKPLQQKSGMEKIFDVLTEEFHLRLSPSSGNEKLKITEDENLQPMVKIEVKLTRETPAVNEQKSNIEKQNRTRSNSVNNNHNSNTTVIDNENR